MDISDIDLVIVYGVPDGMNQLYQVLGLTCVYRWVIHEYVHIYLKLCGRAGRGGCDSRAHVFYSSNKKKVDAKVKDFCVSKENCRRQAMLNGVGSNAVGSKRSMVCCDVY